MSFDPWDMMDVVRPSIEGQTVESVVDGVPLYGSLADVEPIYGEMDMLYVLM